MTEASVGEAYITGVIELLDSSRAFGPKISLPIKKRRESVISPVSTLSLPETRVVLEPLPLPQRVRKAGIPSSTPTKLEEKP